MKLIIETYNHLQTHDMSQAMNLEDCLHIHILPSSYICYGQGYNSTYCRDYTPSYPFMKPFMRVSNSNSWLLGAYLVCVAMKLEPPFPLDFFQPQTGLAFFCHLSGDVCVTHGLHFVDLPEKLRSCAVHITTYLPYPWCIHGTGLFTYIYHWENNQIKVNTPYMDGMGDAST